MGSGDHLREHGGSGGTDWRRAELLVPSVSLARISVLPILSTTDDCRVTATERVIHPRVQRVLEVLVVDERGRPLLTVARVARVARGDDDLSETFPMLTVVALIALVPMVSLVPVVSLVALVAFLSVDTRSAVLPVLSRRAILAVLSKRSVLSAADV